MLFHSLEFILLFLPLVLLVYRGLESFNYLRVAIIWLILASLFFYAYWNWSYVFLLLGSIGINYLLGYGLVYYRSQLLLGVGIGLNLAVLGYYKYSGFFLENLNQWGLSTPQLEILLPLGISFFTFQQIAFLLDVYGKKIQVSDFSRYALFISFFPQLIAGPIVHYQEIVPQMGKRRSYAVFSQDFQLGLRACLKSPKAVIILFNF
jgi:alginate O-acetyltransferase complex protein AlgI